jgi:transposase
MEIAMYYVGIDWADTKHDVCLLSDDGKILSQLVIKHDWAGFQQLATLLTSLEDVRINIERPDGLLMDWLTTQPWALYVTQSNALAARRPRRSKDDKGDAFLLAHLLRLNDPDCRPLVKHSETVEHLRQLLNAYDNMLRHQTRMINQLKAQLKLYFPQALQLFSAGARTLILLDFLKRYPTPQLAQALTLAEFDAFLALHKYCRRDKVAEIYAILQQPMPRARVDEGYALQSQALLPMLEHIYRSKQQLKRKINAVFSSHPEADWWLHWPGVGPLTAARLLAYIGDNRARFESSAVLQAIAGTVPVTRRSGHKQIVEFRHACSHELRSTMDDFARLSVRHSGWASAYFQQQVNRGHKKTRAYRAVANNWLRIIWKLWQTGERYDEAVHVANRARRGQPKTVPALAH